MKTMRVQLAAGLLAILFAVTAGATEPAAANAENRRKPRTEVEWEIAEIVAHIAETAAYAKTKTLDPHFQVDVVDRPSAKGLWVAVQTSGSEPVLISEIATGDFTVSFESYVGLTTELLARFGLRAESATISDGAALLQRLTDFTLTQLQTENQRVSAWLTREPLNPAAHEEAALILAALGLKERAGYHLADQREACLKATAHLALATSLRGEKGELGMVGRLARESILASYGDDAGVADRLKMWRALGKPSRGEEAWLNALTLYCTGDWRVLNQPLTASLLERMMYVQALRVHRGTSSALGFFRKRNAEVISDWGQIFAPYNVESGNIFAKATFFLALKDVGDIYKSTTGRSPALSDRLADILSAKVTRGVEADPEGQHLVVIPWSTWSRFFERHLIHAVLDAHSHLVTQLGLREEGKTLRVQAEKLLEGVELFPLLRSLLLNNKPHEEKDAKDTPIWTADPETMRAAYAFLESNPQRVTAAMWFHITGPAGAIHPPGAPGYHAWFAVGPAGPLDVTHSPFAGYNVAAVPDARLELLARRMPYSFGVLEMCARRTHRTPATVAQFDQLYSSLVETDEDVMKRRAALLGDDTESLHEYEKIAALDPDEWSSVAARLVEKGHDDEAAVAYQREMDEAYNRVHACNDAKWLVDYYVDKNNVEEARKVATMAAEVYCSAGLETMARFYESQKQYDDAERFYKKMVERYSEETELSAFYVRHEKQGGGRFKALAAAGLKKLFPDGPERVKLSDFSGPPSDGVEVQSDSERSRRIGIAKGVIIGALDGYRVHSLHQYERVKALSRKPESALVYWDGKTWAETTGSGRLRRIGATMGTYAPKK